MKAAPGSGAMFLRPDWRKSDQYKEFLDPESRNFVAWEFLRRSPDYHQDFLAFQSEALRWHSENPDFQHPELDGPWDYPGGDLSRAAIAFEEGNAGRHAELLDHFYKRWKVCWIFNPDRDGSGEEFVMDAYDRPDLFKPVDIGRALKIEGPRVMIPIDLSEPLEVLQDRVMWTIKRLRKEGIERGVITPRTNRMLAPRVYVEYLRILDGEADGATVRELGEVLQPLAANDPEARQRDKRIRAALDAAQKMRDGGYRVLLTDS